MGGITTTELRRIFGPLTLSELLFPLSLFCFESSDSFPLEGSLKIDLKNLVASVFSISNKTYMIVKHSLSKGQ